MPFRFRCPFRVVGRACGWLNDMETNIKEEKVMAEEAKTVVQQNSLSNWSGPLTLGTIAAGALSFTAAQINFPVIASVCCGLGAIALCRAVMEKKWIFALGAVLVMAIMVMGALAARDQMNRSARQMQQAFDM